MTMNKFAKPMTLLPILIGAAVGAILFMLGDADDAPGLILVGLAVGFLLIMCGVYNTGAIKKGFLAPILMLCFGVGGILFSVILLLDGEFEESPGIALIGVALGAILIAIGMIRLRKAQVRKLVRAKEDFTIKKP